MGLIRGIQFVSLLCVLTLFQPRLWCSPVRAFPFEIRALVYDGFTKKLYATSPSGLLQIDPNSGALLKTFSLGTNLSRLHLGGGNGLWIGVDGEGAVRRFRLESLTAEDPIIVHANSVVQDISASSFDPYLLAVATRAGGESRGSLIRSGIVLPGWQRSIRYLALHTTSIFSHNSGNINEHTIDRFGINGAFRSTGGPQTAISLKISENVLYTGRGSAWRFTEPGITSIQLLPSAPGTVTINSETKEILFLSSVSGAVRLSRFDRIQRQTGSYVVPGLTIGDPTDWSMAAWGSNKLAFHTTSNLYLMHLDDVFLPSDVQVIRQDTTPANPQFAVPVTVSLLVTNHGPGPAFSVIVSNLFPAGTLLVNDGVPVSKTVPILQPGESFELSATILPASPGLLKTFAGVNANTEQDSRNNASEFSFHVGLDNPQLIRLPSSATAMAYDSATAKLFYYNRAELGAINPSIPRFSRPIPMNGPGNVAMNAAGGFLALGYLPGVPPLNSIKQINTINLQETGLVASSSGALLDLAVSPADPNLVISSDSFGTFISRNSGQFSQLDSVTGNLGFSEDGSLFFRADSTTCTLDIYTVGPGGLTLLKRAPEVACGQFVVRGGRLLFNSGIIFDFVSGEKSFSGFAPPLFFSLPKEGAIDLLHRTNGAWSLIRFNSTNQQPVLTVNLPDLPLSILATAAAGEDWLAVQSGTTVYLQRLPLTFSGIRVSHRPGGELSLWFKTNSGKRYRVEQSDYLGGPWTGFGSEVIGDGFTADVLISTVQSRSGFYRVLETD